MAGWFSRQSNRLKGYGGKIFGSSEIRANHDIIRQSFQRLTGWKHREIREETFANAYARFNLNEKELKTIYGNFLFRFYLFLSFLFIDVALLAYFIATGNWTGLMPAIGFFALCIVQVFIATFRAYQISRRELVGVYEWWKDPDNWWPKPFKGQKPRNSSGGKSMSSNSSSAVKNSNPTQSFKNKN